MLRCLVMICPQLLKFMCTIPQDVIFSVDMYIGCDASERAIALCGRCLPVT